MTAQPRRPDWLEQFVADQHTQHPQLAKLWLRRDASGNVILSKIEISRADRGRGIGEAVMRALLDAADAAGDTLALTPDAAFGGSVTKLRAWYRRLGFQPNTGRRRDFTTQESMIRPPATPNTGDDAAARAATVVAHARARGGRP